MVASRKKTQKTVPKKRSRWWSARVTQKSDALDLQSNIFKSNDPSKIAHSLKRSAEKSNRKKGTPFQSALSMLNFYINRAGSKLSAAKKSVLKRSKNKLREAFGRPAK
jgi:hypothetical protein